MKEIPAEKKSVVIITGMSGSGKHTAFNAFEDLGYFCVDNLPTALIPRLIQMTIVSGGQINKLAIVVDVRLGETVSDFKRLLQKLNQLPFDSKVIFFDASERVLNQRYSETRRAHPLARQKSLPEGFQLEKEKLSPIRALADLVVDTTDFSVHDLRHFIYDRFQDRKGDARMFVSLVSFGFKRGLPHNADLIFDVRFLPNPYFVPGLKEKSGEDQAVVDYLSDREETGEFLDRLEGMLEYLLPRYSREGKSYCTVGIGCTGGRHRSVMVAAEIARRLSSEEFEVNLIHRDLHLDEQR